MRQLVCNNFWHWFVIPTAGTVSSVTVSQQPDAEGVVRATSTTVVTTEQQGVVLTFDGEWDPRVNRYPTSDFIIANGENALPTNWNNPSVFAPQNGMATTERLLWMPARDRLTHTLGMSSSQSSDGTCSAFVADSVFVGVRCAWGAGLIPCAFDFEATLLPRTLANGRNFTAPIAENTAHHFAMPLGAWDVRTAALRPARARSSHPTAAPNRSTQPQHPTAHPTQLHLQQAIRSHHPIIPSDHTIRSHHLITPSDHTIRSHHPITPSDHTIRSHHPITPSDHTIRSHHPITSSGHAHAQRHGICGGMQRLASLRGAHPHAAAPALAKRRRALRALHIPSLVRTRG